MMVTIRILVCERLKFCVRYLIFFSGISLQHYTLVTHSRCMLPLINKTDGHTKIQGQHINLRSGLKILLVDD